LLPTGFLDLENVNYISEQDYEKINRRSEALINGNWEALSVYAKRKKTPLI
jgi:hypothetical protein